MAEKRPAQGKTAGDDRNLVDTEASEGGLDLESWVITFWHANRKTILTAIMVALVIVVGLQLYRIISAQTRSLHPARLHRGDHGRSPQGVCRISPWPSAVRRGLPDPGR